ncbi:hypothetical protein MLD38_015844 [Melastoma candidum]|uniref:Uncharacterized protein n=1 Tax=Melastoma candidum TaxID=119954 RepID=A0ACB9RIN7_9MYRT|nr:hypothetical protein MLD38_015844 [Melastoma candidum]
MDPADNSFYEGKMAGILVEFLEVAITSIVYMKGIYPAGAFERRRYLNLVVHEVRHPALREYIHSAVSGLKPFIQKGSIERVAVIFSNNVNMTLERFIFKLAAKQSSDPSSETDALESSLRSFLTKLQVCQAQSAALPKDCRWEITGYFRSLPEDGPSKEGDSPLWVATGMSQWQSPPLITPIKSMSNGTLSLQLYLERNRRSQPSNAVQEQLKDPASAG